MSETAANQINDAITSSARSVREAAAAMDEVAANAAFGMRRMIRRSPVVTVATAVAAGFLIGVAVAAVTGLLYASGEPAPNAAA
jgi:ElaB/YqjD/DUF883 family membrane-anchored ribosome-binding protein